MKQTYAIIDGHAQFFRAYYAIHGGMTSPVTGESTQMAYGFVNMLLKLLKQLDPAWLVVVIDAAGDQDTFRSTIYPQYKAHREPPPADFGPQVARCLEVLATLRIPVLAVERVEADDVIATLVKRVRSEHPQAEVRIISKDKDLAQLLDDKTALYDVQTDVTLSAEVLFDSKGVKPSQVVDMLTLMGDTADNIPGVVGIGPKTAAQLVTQFGSLDGVLANLDKLTPKRRDAIAGALENLALARSLVRLKDDCEFSLLEADSRVNLQRADVSGTIELLRVLGFRGLRDDLARLLGAATDGVSQPQVAPEVPRQTAAATRTRPRKTAADSAGQGTLFGAVTEPDHDTSAVTRRTEGYTRISDAGTLKQYLMRARVAASGGATVAFDTETDSLSKVHSLLVGVSLSYQEGQAVYIPIRSPEPSTHLTLESARELLGPFLADPSVAKTAHNLKFDLQVLSRHGMQVRGIGGDSMVESHLVEPERSSHGMDALAEAILNHRCIPISQLIGSGAHQRTFDQVELSVATEYAAEDADIALRLHQALAARVKALGMQSLLSEVELPLIEVLARMEIAGIKVDSDELDRQRARLQNELESLRGRIAAASPHPINPDSPRQLAAALFNRPSQSPPGLGLRVLKRTTTGASTDSEVLERLMADPEVTTQLPSLVLEHRQLNKLVGTYLIALKEAIDPVTGRIHASFHQTGTATGRLSSSDPNLQNIPIRTPVGRDIRKAFVAPSGFLLLSVDYSQVELRMLAHLCQDPALMEAFHSGVDIHTAVAAEVNGVSIAEVTKDQRSAAKMVNFGIVYGITPFGLARRLGPGTRQERAKAIIDDYRARFSGIAAFLAACIEKAREQGFVSTILGRRRSIPQVHSRNPAERAFGERIAVNSVVQGSAADLIKVAMLRVERAMSEQFPRARLLLQIHDELVLEVPEGEAEAALKVVVHQMETAMSLRVPLRAEGGFGADWSQT